MQRTSSRDAKASFASGSWTIKIAWDCADPGVEVLPDGMIVTTTYGHWTEGQEPYIVAVRIKPEELRPAAKAG